jgi:DNA-binding phage protein
MLRLADGKGEYMTTKPSSRQSTKLDTTYHDQRLARRLQDDPEFRQEFERSSREVAAIDDIVHMLDDLRAASGLSKAELAREVGKNPASIRRLLTSRANPELRTVVALANALDAEVKIVPRRRAQKRLARRRSKLAAA